MDVNSAENVDLSVCQSVYLSAEAWITEKRINGFWWNFRSGTDQYVFQMILYSPGGSTNLGGGWNLWWLL